MIQSYLMKSTTKSLFNRYLVVILVLSACTGVGLDNQTQTSTGQHALDWLVGCWITDDRSVKENWAQSEDKAYMFGHSVTTRDGKVVFFEQLRIDVDASNRVFNAYPRGIGPTQFKQDSIGPQTISFRNSQNDYPQRISYTRTGSELTASISLLDGTKANHWNYMPCVN